MAKDNSAKGCGIALAVVGGGILLLVVIAVAAGAFAFYKVSQSEDGRRIMGGVAEMSKLMLQANTGPGTSELRAAGCSTAMITPVDRLMKAATKFVPPEKQDGHSLALANEAVMVMCQFDYMSKVKLNCGQVARIYAKAVPTAPEKFIVMVQKQGRRERACSGYFDKQGNKVGEADKDTMQLVPNQ